MRYLLVIFLASFCSISSLSFAADVSQEPSLVKKLAGVYKEPVDSGMVDGSTYKTEDILELVPVSDEATYFRVKLEFFNGHSCSLSGIATYEKPNKLVYKSSEDDEEKCLLTMTAGADSILFDDNHGSCNNYCGARGGWTGADFALKKKRKIKYMPLVLKSEQYGAAIAEYNKSKETPDAK